MDRPRFAGPNPWVGHARIPGKNGNSKFSFKSNLFVYPEKRVIQTHYFTNEIMVSLPEKKVPTEEEQKSFWDHVTKTNESFKGIDKIKASNEDFAEMVAYALVTQYKDLFVLYSDPYDYMKCRTQNFAWNMKNKVVWEHDTVARFTEKLHWKCGWTKEECIEFANRCGFRLEYRQIDQYGPELEWNWVLLPKNGDNWLMIVSFND